MAKRSRKLPVHTYEDRVRSYRGFSRAEGDQVLSEFASLYGPLERRLFADLSAGRSIDDLKRSCLSEERVPGRLFNSLRSSVEGKMDAVRASMKRERDRKLQ